MAGVHVRDKRDRSQRHTLQELSIGAIVKVHAALLARGVGAHEDLAASMHGIAPARRARPWIPYGPSEQSRWAPQLGQRSWQVCMSIIACPHMGHSFLLPADIHQTPRNRLILLILAGTVPVATAIRLRARLRQGRRLPAWIADARCHHGSEERRN